jgi:predicted nucleic acid-binding Zn ribbon protein
MPTYVYKVVAKAEDDPSAFFEVRQSMSDSALAVHPETGEAVERVICAPMIGGKSAPPGVTTSAKPSHSHGPGCGCH